MLNRDFFRQSPGSKAGTFAITFSYFFDQGQSNFRAGLK
jgi:hypothetical protein